MANIQRYRLMLLATQVEDFKDGLTGNDPTPVKAELENYFTFLELLALWPEESRPFDHARVLAETKASSKIQRYLLNTIDKVAHASTEELLTVVDRYIDEHRKLIAVLNKQVKELEEVDKDRLARIEELLQEIGNKQDQIDGLERTNNDLIAELSEHDQGVEETRLTIDRMAANNNELHAQLEAIRQERDGYKDGLEEQTKEVHRLMQMVDDATHGALSRKTN